MANYSVDEIEATYAQILENLLFPPHVRDQLIATQTIEKKLQMIQMHKDTLKDKSISEFGEKQINLMNNIRAARTPDIEKVISLRSMLSTSNREFLQAFIDAKGIVLLIKLVNDRLCKIPMTELDAAILYESLLCFKMIMNNGLGMNAVVNTPRAIEHVCKSLKFEWKAISLVVSLLNTRFLIPILH
jgi:hypothetical protein